MTTYYISPTGNDSNNGTSESTPWKSISKVNGFHPAPGDQILFQGGQTFSGTLNWWSGGGTAAAPIVIGSYGTGRATINGGTGKAIYFYNIGGIAIQNLICVGTVNTNKADAQVGIQIEANTNSILPPVSVTNCDISGFYKAGLLLMADSTKTSFASASITNNSFHDNVIAGMLTWASLGYYIQNVYIANNNFYNNPGTSAEVCSGNGLWCCGIGKGSVIERNIAYHNGVSSIGGCGIWTNGSDQVLMQYNASCNNHTTTGPDGDGFDFDNQNSNSIMQYNYAANNDGGGFILCQWSGDNTFTGNVVRYNISANNSRQHGYGEISVWGQCLNTEIYNNTVYTTASNGNSAFRVTNDTIGNLFVNNLNVYNNIFVTTGGSQMIHIPSAEMNGAKNLTFNGNVYYGSGSPASFLWGSNKYNFTQFQNISQEKNGLEANPGLTNGGYSNDITTVAQVQGNALQQFVEAYTLGTNSTIIGKGVDLSKIGYSLPTDDFFGNALSSITAGAHSPTSNAAPTVVTTSSSSSGTPTQLNQIKGTIFGTTGSWSNQGNTVNKAADGDLNTFFDAPSGDNDVVGLDLGSPPTVSLIKYAPRSGFAGRMVGGVFQAADDANFTVNLVTLYTITTTPVVGQLTAVNITPTAKRYWRYVSPKGGYGNISEFQLFG